MKSIGRRRKRGFTLIELMLVVAIIGVLAAIAIPKFANMVIKSKEAALRGAVGSLRSAMCIYFADNEGIYPSVANAFSGLTAGNKYLDQIPLNTVPTVPGHKPYAIFSLGGVINDNFSTLFGVTFWAPNNGLVFTSGNVVVNCTHTDTAGNVWSTF